MFERSPPPAPGGGRYRLRWPLDASHTAWRAAHEALGVDVLLRYGRDPELLRAARAEAASPHPLLPAVLDTGQDDTGRYWRVDALAAGTPLARALEVDGPWAESEALELILRLLDLYAVAAAGSFPVPTPTIHSLWVVRTSRGATRVQLQLQQEPPPTNVTLDPELDAPEPSPCAELLQLAEHLLAGAEVPLAASIRASFPTLTLLSEQLSAVERGEEGFRAAIDRLRALARPAQSAPQVAARRTVGRRYELLNALGAGGMGAVYRALDRLSGRVVSLKIAHGGPAARATVDREFRMLSELRHPHLLEVLDYGLDDAEGPFLVSALYENAQDLTAAAESRPLPARMVLVAQLGAALAYLHAHGVLHRDIKPANVVVVDGHLRLLDFGISVDEHDPLAGRRAGTLGYMAPEVAAGAAPTRASDLWSFGVVAAEVLLGAVGGRFEVGASGGASDELEGILAPLLAPVPEARPERLDETVAQLQRLAQQSPASAQAAAYRSPRFIGRTRELARLADATLRLAQGQGGTLRFEGPSGVGKSRLLERIRTQALLGGLPVVAIAGDRVEAGARSVWRPAIGWWVANGRVDPMARAAFARLEPSLADAMAAPSAPAVTPAESADQLLVAFSFAAEQANRPLLLIIDDAERLGPLDRRVLDVLCRASARAPLFVLCTSTDGAVGLGGEAAALGPLDALDAERLARALGLSDAAMALHEGNPGALVDIATDPGGEGSSVGRAERRVAALSAPAAGVLTAAAVLGGDLDDELLRAVLAPALAVQVDDAVAEGLRVGVLTRARERARVANPRCAALLAARMDAGTAGALRRAAAGRLAERVPAPSRVIAGLYEACGDAAAAAPWLRRAGQDALALGDLADGAALLERAGPPDGAADAADWSYQIGEARYFLGQRDAAEARLRGAVAAVGPAAPRSTAGWSGFFAWEVARLLLPTFFRRRAAANLAPAMHTLALCAYSDSRPFTGTLFLLGGLNHALAWAEFTQVTVLLSSLHLTFGTVGLHGAARALQRRVERARMQLATPEDAYGAYISEAFYLVGVGEWEQARARAGVAEQAARAIGKLRTADEALLALAWCEQARGACPESVPPFAALDANAERRGDDQMVFWARTGLVYAALWDGDAALAAHYLDACTPCGSPDDTLLPVLRAAVHAQRGEWTACWQSAALAHTRHPADVHGRGVHLATLYLLCDTLSRARVSNDPGLRAAQPLIAEALAARLAQLRRHLPVAPIVAPWAHLVGARVAEAAGDAAAAASERQQGAAAARARGVRVAGLLAPLAG